MAQIRTARGRLIDMEALAKKNENAIAVAPDGSLMNARGDLLDNKRRVIRKAEDTVVEQTEPKPVSLSQTKELGSQLGRQKKTLPRNPAQARERMNKLMLETESLANDGGPVIREYDDEDEEAETEAKTITRKGRKPKND